MTKKIIRPTTQIVWGTLFILVVVGCAGTSTFIIEPAPATRSQIMVRSPAESPAATVIPSQINSGNITIHPSPTATETIPTPFVKSLAPFAITSTTGTVVPENYLPIILSSPSATAVPQVSLPVGPGSDDVVPHQIVRAKDDRLYLFSMQQFSPLIRVFTTSLPGLPNAAADFILKATASEVGLPISIDAVYDGQDTIHVLVNTKDTGLVLDYPFDIVSGAFHPAIQIANDSHKIDGYYIGTSGVSGIVDKNGVLLLVYWTINDKIRCLAFTYDSGTNHLTQQGTGVILDNNGTSNHPAVAVSPVDNTLWVSWVNTSAAGTILQVRERAPGGIWGSVADVSTAPVWHSLNAGVNIDQGPSMLVDYSGAVYLAYIQDFDNTGSYGQIHVVSQSGNGWVDRALPIYTHDPALALSSTGAMYLIGHGHPNNQSCTSMDELCVTLRKPDGSWASPMILAAPDPGTSFDGSPSVKWSVAGNNRPETIEFVFFRITNGDYNNPTLYYGRLP